MCLRFRRLFDLSLNKFSTVAEMFSLGWEVGGAAWRWRRLLWELEEELLGECRHLLYNFVVQSDVFDKWQWLPDLRGVTPCAEYIKFSLLRWILYVLT